MTCNLHENIYFSFHFIWSAWFRILAITRLSLEITLNQWAFWETPLVSPHRKDACLYPQFQADHAPYFIDIAFYLYFKLTIHTVTGCFLHVDLVVRGLTFIVLQPTSSKMNVRQSFGLIDKAIDVYFSH